MSVNWSLRLTAGLLAVGCLGPAAAQAIDSASGVRYLDPRSLPAILRRYARAAGDRLWIPGHERLVLQGTASVNGQDSAWSGLVELPGKVRIQYGRERRTAVFDLDQASGTGTLTDEDEAALETLSYDTPDGFLFSIANGNGPRVLGFAFQAAARAGFASRVDIHEAVQTIRSRKKRLPVAKHFEFDTTTGLLSRVTYTTLRNGAPVPVNVTYDDYVVVNSQHLPTRISRREAGGVTLDLTVSTAAVVAAQNDNAFSGQ